MAYSVVIFPLSNSVAFNNTGAGLSVIRQDSYANNIQDWQSPLPYVQKVLNSDSLTIMVQISYTSLVSLLASWPSGFMNVLLKICDHNKQEITAVTPLLNVQPFTLAPLPAPAFTDPVTGTTSTMYCFCWSFKMTDFAAQIPDGGVYYLQLDNGGDGGPQTFYSEPMLVSNTHPDTLLVQFAYKTNNATKGVITGPWVYDVVHEATRPLTFGVRVEGYVIPGVAGPKAVNIGYLQQNYNQLQIKTQQKRVFDLHIGEISVGIPWYMLEMVTEALLADNVAIQQYGDTSAYGYVVYSGSSGDGLNDVWKVKASDVNPLLYASCTLMQKDDRQGAFISPTPVPVAGRIFAGEFNSVFA